MLSWHNNLKKQWPEPRPIPWRILAIIDWITTGSSLFSAKFDVVLLYHSIGGISGANYKWDLPTKTFYKQIKTLDSRFEIVDLEQMVKQPLTDRKRVAITFDDGFRNVFENAIPILKRFDAPATIFCSSSYINDGNLNRFRRHHNIDQNADDIVMTDEQIQRLVEDPLFTIGNHTATHPDLTTVTDKKTLKNEIEGGKQALEDQFGITVDRFAYPYGKFDHTAADIITDTHKIAVTSEPSLLKSDRNPHQLPRIGGCQPASVLCFEASDISHQLRTIARQIGSVPRGLI